MKEVQEVYNPIKKDQAHLDSQKYKKEICEADQTLERREGDTNIAITQKDLIANILTKTVLSFT